MIVSFSVVLTGDGSSLHGGHSLTALGGLGPSIGRWLKMFVRGELELQSDAVAYVR
jgi:hypothetical protein